MQRLFRKYKDYERIGIDVQKLGGAVFSLTLFIVQIADLSCIFALLAIENHIKNSFAVRNIKVDGENVQATISAMLYLSNWFLIIFALWLISSSDMNLFFSS